MIEIKHNLRVLIARWSVENNRTLTLGKLAEKTGINSNTLARYANGKSTRVDLSVCAKVLKWFHDEGFYYTMGDLFTMHQPKPVKHIDDIQHE